MLQSGSKQTVKKIKAKLPNLDLSFLDDDEDDTLEVDAAQRGIEEIALRESNAIGGMVEKEAMSGRMPSDGDGAEKVEGGRPIDPTISDSVI